MSHRMLADRTELSYFVTLILCFLVSGKAVSFLFVSLKWNAVSTGIWNKIEYLVELLCYWQRLGECLKLMLVSGCVVLRTIGLCASSSYMLTVWSYLFCCRLNSWSPSFLALITWLSDMIGNWNEYLVDCNELVIPFSLLSLPLPLALEDSYVRWQFHALGQYFTSKFYYCTAPKKWKAKLFCWHTYLCIHRALQTSTGPWATTWSDCCRSLVNHPKLSIPIVYSW